MAVDLGLKLDEFLQGNPLRASMYPGRSSGDYSAGGSLGRFGENSIFEPSPTGQRLIDYYKQKYKKDIDVKPFAEAPDPAIREGQIPWARGVFYGNNPLGGGSSDPQRRAVYVNPTEQNSGLFVVAHELGHAFDPELASRYQSYKSAGPARGETLTKSYEGRNPTVFLKTYMTGPEVKLKSETEAQRAAKESFKALGIPTGEIESDPWFKGYPAAFIETGLDQAAALYGMPRNVPRGVPQSMMDETLNRLYGSMGQPHTGAPAYYRPALGTDDPEIDFRSAVTKELLNLALDKRYRQAEDLIKSQTRSFIEDRLN